MNNRISILPLPLNSEDTHRTVYPTVLQDERELVLVDCGFPHDLPKIEQAMEQCGVNLEKLTKIILTHHDIDHMGALKEMLDKHPTVEILCSEIQAPYVTGKKKSLRLEQAEKIHETLPECAKPDHKKFMDAIAAIRKVDKVTAIRPGDVLPICGGIEIIDTKGHMPGHISLYMPEHKTLIAGDALTVESGKLCNSSPRFTLNSTDALNSVKNLMSYDIQKVICYHGGEFTGDIQESLKRIVG